jgi:hypothetical protein
MINHSCIGGILTAAMMGLVGNSMAQMWNDGLGGLNFQHVLGASYPASWGIIQFVLAANSPQAAVSFYYLFYNSIWTTMLLGSEWSSYAQKRKFLRVSSPQGQQRQTYRLQIPYAYSISLLVAMILLHWLISQSIFLANSSYYYRGEQIQPTSAEAGGAYPEFTVGVSYIGVFFAIILAGSMVLALLINGFRRYNPNMPLAGSCSAAISAACHPPPDDTDAALSAIGWGVIESDSQSSPFGHCCFTNHKAEAPVVGALYS